MNEHGFEQVPCPKCGTVVWIAPQVGQGYCPGCQTAVALSKDGSTGAPVGKVTKAGGGFPVGRLIGIVIGVVVIGAVSIGGWILKDKLFGGGGKGKAGYVLLGIDPEHADPDALILAAQKTAKKKWHYRAVWWAAEFRGVESDGTIDLTTNEGGATVTCIKLLEASYHKKDKRKDSVKDFKFLPKGLDFKKSKYFLKPIPTGTKAYPVPSCKVKELVTSLGLAAGTKVRVAFDPGKSFGFGKPSVASWHVKADDGSLDAYYDLTTCAPTGGKEASGAGR